MEPFTFLESIMALIYLPTKEHSGGRLLKTKFCGGGTVSGVTTVRGVAPGTKMKKQVIFNCNRGHSIFRCLSFLPNGLV